MEYNLDNYSMTYKAVCRHRHNIEVFFWSPWEPSWAMTQESVSCIRGLRFMITILYNIVLFGDVPL